MIYHLVQSLKSNTFRQLNRFIPLKVIMNKQWIAFQKRKHQAQKKLFKISKIFLEGRNRGNTTS